MVRSQSDSSSVIFGSKRDRITDFYWVYSLSRRDALASEWGACKRGKSEGWCSKGRKQEEENVDKQEDGTKLEWFPSWIS